MRSLYYATVTDAPHGVGYERRALVIKVNICNGCRVILILPADRWLIGMTWEELVFINTALPLGVVVSP